MIFIKEGVIEKINEWTDNSIRIVADFDRTLTDGKSDSSWGILSKSGLVPKDYIEERQKLYNYYRPIELNQEIEIDEKNRLMKEWFEKHINLIIKYRISEDIINNAINDLSVMSFREGAKEFLQNMRDRKIPVIIISAGIGNFIKKLLILNGCDFENIYIISNFIRFENGVAIGIIGNVIHTLNKNEIFLSEEVSDLIKKRSNAILLGDSIADIKMISDKETENVLKIGFLEENEEENKKYYQQNFDIVCTDNTSFSELSSKFKILK